MPSDKSPSRIVTGPGLAAEDSVPEAALLFSTTPIIGGGGGGSLAAHLADPTDAHDASAISLNPDAGNYDADNVQSALNELGGIAPLVNEIGQDLADVPNSAVPLWTTGAIGGFRNPSGGDYGGLGLGALVETFNIVPLGNSLAMAVVLYPADRGTIGLLRIDPDGTEVDIGAKVDLAANFTEATRGTGQADYSDINPGMYSLSLTNRRPVLSAYPSNPGLEPYETDYTWYQIGTLLIILEGAWASYPAAGEHYRLLHVRDGEPFATASAQYGISVPTPGAVLVNPQNALLRERWIESTATTPAFSGGEPTLLATTPGSPPNRVQSSGVWGFGRFDTFDITASGTAADNCFDLGADVAGDVTISGGRDPLELSFDGFGIADSGLAFDETDEGYSAASAPDVADTFTTVVTTTVTVGAAVPDTDASRDAKFNATLNRPGVSSVTASQVTTADTLMVTSFTSAPTSIRDKEERFGRDDPYRYPQDVDLGSAAVAVASAGGYDPSKLIDADATTADALQVAFGALIYPQTDFTVGHQPTTGQPDYSAFAAEPAGTARYYQRVFEVSQYGRRGTIEIEGVDLTDFGRAAGEVYDASFWPALLSGATLSAGHLASRAGQVLVLLRIPGISDWMDLGAPVGDGDLSLDTPGRGCLHQDLGGGVYEYDLGWTPSASIDGTPIPHLAVRVYMIMDGGAVVLTKEINRITFP